MHLKPFDLKIALQNEKLLPPWWSTKEEEDSFKRTFTEELKNELPRGHSLSNQAVSLIARGSGDDCLFKIKDSNQVAWVHLTWKGSIEILPYPITVIYKNLQDWYLNEYIPTFFEVIGVNSSLLKPIDELLIGLALGFVSVATVESYIYELDTSMNELSENDYLELISINFEQPKHQIIESLNERYRQRYSEARLDLNEIYKLFNVLT